MARLRNGVYNAPPPEQQTRKYQERRMQERTDLRTKCAEILQQSDMAHAEAARDYHRLWLQT